MSKSFKLRRLAKWQLVETSLWVLLVHQYKVAFI